MLWKIWRWWKFIKSSRESRHTARHCVFSLSTRLIQNTCRLTSSGLLLVHAQRVHKFCFSYFLLYEWRSESGEDWRPEIRETERREECSEKWQLDSIFWDDGRTLVFREKDEKLDEWILFHQRHHTHATEWSVKCVLLSELNSVKLKGMEKRAWIQWEWVSMSLISKEEELHWVVLSNHFGNSSWRLSISCGVLLYMTVKLFNIVTMIFFIGIFYALSFPSCAMFCYGFLSTL